MSRLYDALKNAQANLPGPTRMPGRAAQPLAEDAPAFQLIQAIDNRLADRPRRVIQIVGCGPREDVPGVARRLARLSAQSLGRSCLLLDAQMPPLAAKAMPAHPGIAGLPPVAALEAGRPHRQDEGYSFAVGSLFAQTEGGGVDPKELRRSWDRLRLVHDLVVVESPHLGTPLGLAIAPTVDGVVLVVEADRTRIDKAEAARESLIGGGANLLGVVLDKRRFWVPNWLWEML